MADLAIQRIAAKWRDLDWTLLKGSALLSVGTAVARVLGLAFSMVLAAALPAGDFGAVRYAIAVASLVSIATLPFGNHVIARFVSKQQNDPAKVDSALSNLFFLLTVIFALTLLIAVPVLFYLGTFNVGILAVFAGETLFYAYWGLSSGFLAPARLTVAYLGSNLVQIILTVVLILVLGIHSPTLALLIYGLSYILPLTLLTVYWPLPGHPSRRLIRRPVIGELLRFSTPIWVSNACYVLAAAVDLLLLERYVTSAELGAYSLSKTLATMFTFVPLGISTLLMPRVAASSTQSHGQVLKTLLALSLLLNLAVLALYLPIVAPFTQRVFGPGYVVSLAISFLLAAYMIVTGVHSLITAVFVGSGRPQAESATRIADLAVTALGCWFLVPVYGGMGAAAALLAGKIVAVAAYGALQLARPGVNPRREAVAAAPCEGQH